MPPVGPVHPAGLIADFSRAHPGVAIAVREDVAFALLGQLRDGELDLVMALVDPDALEGLEGVHLLDEELVFIAPLDHPLARVKRVPVERLAGEALVSYGAGSARCSRLCRAAMWSPRPTSWRRCGSSPPASALHRRPRRSASTCWR